MYNNSQIINMDTATAVKDISGTKFNYLTAISFIERKDSKTYWKCFCDCGAEVITYVTMLKSGCKKSCGCHRRKPRLDLAGQIFGRLTVLEYIKKNVWKCVCECGKIVNKRSGPLKDGHTKSCGCAPHVIVTYGKNHKNWTGGKYVSGLAWGTMQKGAKVRNLDFTISLSYIEHLLEMQDFKCALSNLPLGLHSNSNKSTRVDITASLDRIDPTQGYIEGNVQWVHKHINLMKLDFTQAEFINYCKQIADHCCLPV